MAENIAEMRGEEIMVADTGAWHVRSAMRRAAISGAIAAALAVATIILPQTTK